jgi:tRNA-2-methylthio-N6-dimethylallyladenosine synthase
MKKVYLETFGCQMNVSDSERVATKLASEGYAITNDAASADVVLINTCSVREKAEQKLFSKIGRIRKQYGDQPVIGVMGCVAQLEGETLFQKAPSVDFIIGTTAVGRVHEAIASSLETRDKYFDLGGREADYDWSVAEGQRHSKYVSFLPIIEGCNKFCTYCIVPFSRGRERSLPAGEIVQHVLKLMQEGVKEVHLIGQNVNSYRPATDSGLEGFKGTTPFSRLLRAVAATGIERIKFTTSFPRDFKSDIVDAIEENENLCNWVHLPVQSGSDSVLKQMRRLHTVDSYKKKVDRIRRSSRDISLSTDIIVGFPGETDADFQQTVDLVKYCEYDSAYVFKYSPRPGTPAFDLGDTIPEREKSARYAELDRVHRQVQYHRLLRYNGRILKVLVERESSKSVSDISGHSTCHKVVNFRGDRDMIGTVKDVRITEIKSNSLYGEVC